ALLNRPTALAADGNGSLFVNDCGNGRIRRITLSTGTIVGVAGAGYAGFGGDGGPAVDAIFRGCGGLAVSGANLLYVADSDNYRVRQIALPGGMVTTVAGAGVPGFRPYGLTADGAGNVFISDTNSNRVLAYHAKASTVATIAGDGTFAYGGDQGPAVRAQLATPSSVAL